jgi:hypothetical protein
LIGKTNELGSFECRWNNSRGEARHRQFTVSLTFVDEKNDFIISAIVIGLLLVGMGIGIKFYLDKVRNSIALISNADQITNIRIK